MPSTVLDLTGLRAASAPRGRRAGRRGARVCKACQARVTCLCQLCVNSRRPMSTIPPMAVTALSLEQLRTAASRRRRSRRRRAARPRARAPAGRDRADRVRELHVAVGARGRRLDADEQVLRGLSRPPLLRRLRGGRRDRAAGHRSREGALRRRARERAAPRRRADEHGRVLRVPRPGRHDPLARALARRPPDARPEGELLRAAVHDRPLRRQPRDEPRRLRRGAAAGERTHRPKLIVCGGSAYPRAVEAERFREIADEVGAYLLCDMAHFAGLVAAGLHPNPVPHCDFVTSTAHKTLAGPRSGFVLCREEHADGARSRGVPRDAGRPAEPRRSPPRRRASRSPARTRSATTSSRCARTPTRTRPSFRRAASTC